MSLESLRTRKEECLSDLQLDALLCDEPSSERVHQLNLHIDECSRCARRFQTIQEDQRSYLQQMPSFPGDAPRDTLPNAVPGAPQDALQDALPHKGHQIWSKRITWSLAPLAAAAGLLFAFLPPQESGRSERAKGQYSSPPFVKEDSKDFLLDDTIGLRLLRPQGGVFQNREDAQPGDVLQVMVVLPSQMHFKVMSIDGNGIITKHAARKMPSPKRRDPSKRNRVRWIMPNALALDEAPFFERFFLFYAEESSTLEGSATWLSTLSKEELLASKAPKSPSTNMNLQSVLLLKDAP